MLIGYADEVHPVAEARQVECMLCMLHVFLYQYIAQQIHYSYALHVLVTFYSDIGVGRIGINAEC